MTAKKPSPPMKKAPSVVVKEEEKKAPTTQSKIGKMQVEYWPLDKIRPYPNNPRRNEQAIPAVAASLAEFGWRQAIVVDKDGFIIAGHTRYAAADYLGMDEAPVHQALNLTPAQVKAYRLADNRVGAIAEDDMEKLMQELAGIMEEGFDLKGMGFTDEELKEYHAPTKKEDLRYLEDFDVMPKAKPTWILISADSDHAAEVMQAVEMLKLGSVRMETSSVKGSDVFNKVPTSAHKKNAKKSITPPK